MADPRQVINAMREVETALNGFAPHAAQSIRTSEQEIARTEQELERRRIQLENELRLAQLELNGCLNTVYVDDDGNRSYPDCSNYEQEVQSIEDMIAEVRRMQQMLAQATQAFRAQASQLRYVLDRDVSSAGYWLRDRQIALEKFELANSFSAVVTMIPAILNNLGVGGGHGAKYQSARQKFLRGLVDDPNQPGYVRGWVKQEVNRLEQVKKAGAAGLAPPGGNKRRVRGIPGLDVGHRIPDIDLPENFRLEDPWTNRSRPARARRLGLPDWLR